MKSEAEAVTEKLQEQGSQASSLCVDKIAENFYTTKDSKVTPLDQFKNFVTNVCPGLNPSVPNGVVVSSCFHAGYFLLNTLVPLARQSLEDGQVGTDAGEEFDKYVDDFCLQQRSAFPHRTQFVRQLKDIEEEEAF